VSGWRAGIFSKLIGPIDLARDPQRPISTQRIPRQVFDAGDDFGGQALVEVARAQRAGIPRLAIAAPVLWIDFAVGVEVSERSGGVCAERLRQAFVIHGNLCFSII
jgi:hypothetical protein